MQVRTKVMPSLSNHLFVIMDNSSIHSAVRSILLITACSSGKGSSRTNINGEEDSFEEAAPLLSLTTTRLRIEGLCCEMEVGLVKELLEPIQGVKEVRVSPRSSIAS